MISETKEIFKNSKEKDQKPMPVPEVLVLQQKLPKIRREFQILILPFEKK